MFAGRHTELSKLNSIYASGKFECVILHGRLRMGKTTLLRRFMADKDCIYFCAQDAGDKENLRSLVNTIEAHTQKNSGEPNLKHYYEEVFERVDKFARTQRVALIIDEYQLLISSNKGLSELICRFIDQRFSTGQLMLIICGSSQAVMESETLGYDTPFHGRRTAQIKLNPLSFFDAKHHYSSFSPYDIAVIYGITGGIPKYLNLMDPNLTIEENIKNTFLNPASQLFEDPDNFIRREVRDPSYYNAVLKAIAAGYTKNSEIAAAVGLETSACTAYLKNLTAFGLIGKYTPMTEKAGKKTVYDIDDSMLRFWYRFVPENLSFIHSGKIDRIWRSVAQGISGFMQEVFRDICRQWVDQRNQSGNMPAKFIETGRWWGYDFITKSDSTIPIVAYSDDDHALFGDAIWSDDPIDIDALRALEQRSRLFNYPNRHLYLFSCSGFTEECARLASTLGANLIVFE